MTARSEILELRATGMVCSSLGTLVGDEMAAAFMKEAAAARESLESLDRSGGFVDVERSHGIASAATHSSVLDLLAVAVGSNPVLDAAHIRRDNAHMLPGHLSSWHIDAEDPSMARMIVYLNTVTAAGATFEAIPKGFPITPLRLRCLGDVTSNRLYDPPTDSELSLLVPREAWRSVSGPPSTTIIASTGSILHRVRPGSGTRWTLTLTYLPSKAPVT